MATLFDGFYQMGFVATDLDRATAALARRFGIEKFRRRRAAEWMESAHGWAGPVMIELIALQPGAEVPAVYRDCAPADPAGVRLHHHGYRVADADGWAAVERRIEQAGLAVAMQGTAMEGQLRYLYADTRAALGFYSEFVCLTGAALSLYDDVPRN